MINVLKFSVWLPGRELIVRRQETYNVGLVDQGIVKVRIT